MRVIRLRRTAADDRGAVAIIVALCAVLLFSAGAYAVDTGDSWQQRRHLVTATDASALAAAQSYAKGGTGCSGVAGDYLGRNDSEATLDSCVHTSTAGGGFVTVTASKTVEHHFAQVFGVDSSDVHSTTSARYGTPSGLKGLRPLALCVDANAALKSWLNLPTGPGATTQTIRITYSKATPDACGADAPGNWGVMDFDGGANSSNDTKDWVLDGYPGLVSIGQQVPGDTGAFSNSISGELGTLRSSGVVFTLPVYDGVTGNGSNARFHVAAFVAVQLVDFRTTGSEANRYLELRFQTALVQGECCDPDAPNTGVKVIQICAVEPGTASTLCS